MPNFQIRGDGHKGIQTGLLLSKFRKMDTSGQSSLTVTNGFMPPANASYIWKQSINTT